MLTKKVSVDTKLAAAKNAPVVEAVLQRPDVSGAVAGADQALTLWPTPKQRAVGILEEAKSLLKRRAAWVQGSWHEQWQKHQDGKMCALGALRYVANGKPTDYKAVPLSDGMQRLVTHMEDALAYADANTVPWKLAENALTDVVRKHGFDDVPDFNDNHGTTKADVLKAFDQAIAKLKD